MTLLTILVLTATLAIVTTIGLLYRDARKVTGRTQPEYLLGWNETGEAVE